MINSCIKFVLGLALCIFVSACSTSPKIAGWVNVEGVPKQLAVYDGVFWAMGTKNFREYIVTSGGVFKDKTIYDIGTGTGVYALLALQSGSKFAVATDIDPDAVLNAKFNAKHFGVEDKIDVRLVPESNPGAYVVLKENERFDIVVSNPPWFGDKPSDLKNRQTTDENYMLIRSIIKDLDRHLNPGGFALLAIGNTYAITLIQDLAAEHHLEMEILDANTNQAFIKAAAFPSQNGFFFPAAIIKLTPHEPKPAP
jgi:release factor glutamine methyltransferase